MEHIQYLELDNTKNYLPILPNELLISIYDYIDINLNLLIKFINELSSSLTNEEIFNYFYKWDSRWINHKFLNVNPKSECIYVNGRPKLFPKYNSEHIYKIPFSYWTINSTLYNIKLIPLFYRPIQIFTAKYDGVTMFEKHNLESIFEYGYTNSYNQKFVYNKFKNSHNYTCRESVLLAFLFSRINYIFTGVELKFYSTKKNKILKKELLEGGFILYN